MAKRLHNLKNIFDYSIAGYTKPNMQMLKDRYTRIMRGEFGAIASKVVLMAPDKFLKNSFSKTDVLKEPLRKEVDLDNLHPKYALPYVDLRRGKALGRGRALVCYKAGILEIPVLVVSSTAASINDFVKKVGKKIEAPEKPKTAIKRKESNR